MKKYKLLWIIIIVIVLAAVIWYVFFRTKEVPISILSQQPTYGRIDTSVTATGTIQPVDTVAVGSQVSGTIKKVYVDFNSVVKKGQLLAEIDPVLLASQKDQVSANLQAAKSAVAYQQSNFSRQKELFDVGGISQADFETAQNTFNAAKDNVNSINAQLTGANKTLSFTKIFSPVDGTVLSRKISAGQTVASSLNTPTLFSIAEDLTKMQVQASVDEADIGNVKVSEHAMFTVDAFPDDTFNGTVNEVRLHPTISANVVTYITIIDASNDDLKLKPGMTANITIYTKVVDSALLISVKALKFKPDSIMLKNYKIKPLASKRNAATSKSNPMKSMSKDSISGKKATVWIVQKDVLDEKQITIGISDGVNVQVISGLNDSDAVAIGIDNLKKSMNKPTQEKSPFMPQRPNNKKKS